MNNRYLKLIAVGVSLVVSLTILTWTGLFDRFFADSPDTCRMAPLYINKDEYPAALADAPIQFPLAFYRTDGNYQTTTTEGVFKDKFHAAEDITKPPGEPVYAIADGVISFSGPKGGYGWLIIIDHPEYDIYSLYGHLSQRLYHKESGMVKKGDLIAHIGDIDENGSDFQYGTMPPHLHFGIRQGRRADYPADGDRRWMAGWTYRCPSTLGWLLPSEFIMSFVKDE